MFEGILSSKNMILQQNQAEGRKPKNKSKGGFYATMQNALPRGKKESKKPKVHPYPTRNAAMSIGPGEGEGRHSDFIDFINIGKDATLSSGTNDRSAEPLGNLISNAQAEMSMSPGQGDRPFTQ
jgi:hypothetical protein